MTHTLTPDYARIIACIAGQHEILDYAAHVASIILESSTPVVQAIRGGVDFTYTDLQWFDAPVERIFFGTPTL